MASPKPHILAAALATAALACVPAPEVWVAPGTNLAVGAADTLDGWYRFSEGPAADADGNVFFSDFVGTRIYRWNAKTERVAVFRDDEVATNGLAIGPDGLLYACEAYAGRVVALDRDAKVTEVASGYQGRRFNSCNDLWVAPDGGLYLTDPKYSDTPKDQDGEHVYYVTPDRKEVIRVIDDLVRPNGIVGTPDGRTVYVVDDGASRTYAYHRDKDGTLGGRTLVAETGADGLAVDPAGRLLIVDEVIEVYEGTKKVATIDAPFFTTNVAFGGQDRRRLFITGKWVVHTLEWGPAQ